MCLSCVKQVNIYQCSRHDEIIEPTKNCLWIISATLHTCTGSYKCSNWRVYMHKNNVCFTLKNMIILTSPWTQLTELYSGTSHSSWCSLLALLGPNLCCSIAYSCPGGGGRGGATGCQMRQERVEKWIREGGRVRGRRREWGERERVKVRQGEAEEEGGAGKEGRM